MKPIYILLIGIDCWYLSNIIYDLVSHAYLSIMLAAALLPVISLFMTH